jgi:hypothetical protein
MFRSGTRPFASFVLASLSALALSTLCAQESPRAGPSGRPPAGDGRGLATFGDRGLEGFGRRPLESFGRRPLARFGDVPLAPMGGLVVPGPSQQRIDARGERRPRPPRSRPFRAPRLFEEAPPTVVVRSLSVASIHGVALAGSAASIGRAQLPPVRPPPIVLDHRPALERLAAALDSEARRAEERGDFDAARSLRSAVR